MFASDSRYTHLERLIDTLLDIWPKHRRFIEKSFAARSEAVMKTSEDLAACVCTLAEHVPGGIEALCRDYQFLCNTIALPEQVHFARSGSYRLSTFEEANAECYLNDEFMKRYMNGLLVSGVFWENHANAFEFFRNTFLPSVAENGSVLEIGPGHGLYLYYAARASNISSLTGWDVSRASINSTRHALQVLDAGETVQLVEQDLYAAPSDNQEFDAVILSEILEHLEDPMLALRTVRERMKPDGKLYINVPANSPMPDHIYLFHDLAHAEAVVRDAGFEIVESKAFPSSGMTLEKATKTKQVVSCVMIASRA